MGDRGVGGYPRGLGVWLGGGWGQGGRGGVGWALGGHYYTTPASAYTYMDE